MMFDSPNQFEQTLRRVFQEEMHGVLQKDLPPLVRTIVREETQDIRDDVTVIRQVQHAQSTQLQSVQVDVRSLKTSVRCQGVLLEDLESRFSTGHEAYGL